MERLRAWDTNYNVIPPTLLEQESHILFGSKRENNGKSLVCIPMIPLSRHNVIDLITDPGAGACRSFVFSAPLLSKVWKFGHRIYLQIFPLKNRRGGCKFRIAQVTEHALKPGRVVECQANELVFNLELMIQGVQARWADFKEESWGLGRQKGSDCRPDRCIALVWIPASEQHE